MQAVVIRDSACFRLRWQACADSEKPETHAAVACARHADSSNSFLHMLPRKAAGMRIAVNSSTTCLGVCGSACESDEDFNLHAGMAIGRHVEMKLVELRMLLTWMLSMRFPYNYSSACLRLGWQACLGSEKPETRAAAACARHANWLKEPAHMPPWLAPGMRKQ